jgi:hypothetical protein
MRNLIEEPNTKEFLMRVDGLTIVKEESGIASRGIVDGLIKKIL